MKRFLTIAGTVIAWLLACLPALQCLMYHVMLLAEFRYTRFDTSLLGMYVILLLIATAPTLVYVIRWLVKRRREMRVRPHWFLVILCVLYLPVSTFANTFIAFGSPFYSETSNPAHYLQLDDLGDYGVRLLYAFFPREFPKDEAEYYYRFVNCVDANYEVYAAWTLTPEEIAQERQRVETLFAQQGEYWTVETARHGGFTCLMCYTQQHPLSLAGNNQYYDHAIFAWNEATGQARYIFNYGVDVPETLLPRCFSLVW